MLEDGIASMMDTLLENEGVSCIYRDDNGDELSMTLQKEPQLPQTIEVSEGVWLEVLIVDFSGRWTDLPFGQPKKNQQIEVNGQVFSIRPGASGKCFRRMSDSQVRIHTVQTQ
jgi:hypothetical protein